MRKASSLVRPAAALAARVHATAGASAFPLAARRLGAWGAQGNVRGFAKKKQEVVVNVSPQGSSKMLRAAVKSAIEGQDPEMNNDDMEDIRPAGWVKVDTTHLTEGQEHLNGIVMFERKYKDETIALLSSNEVVLPDDMEEEYDDEEEEEEEQGEANGGKGKTTSAYVLVAITKPSQENPMFFECVFDRFGFEILRVHVGVGSQGFMSDDSAQTSLLYNLFLTHRDQVLNRDGQDEPPDEPMPASSPEFDSLDPQLQERFQEFITERGFDQLAADFLIREVLTEGHRGYVDFLQAVDGWLDDKKIEGAKVGK